MDKAQADPTRVGIPPNDTAAAAARHAPDGPEPAALASQVDWPAHQRARITRPLCSAPGERHQAWLPVGCCDIQLTAELALLSWWGKGRKQQVTIPARELGRLLDLGWIEREARPL